MTKPTRITVNQSFGKLDGIVKRTMALTGALCVSAC
jgi:hypothetical protein